MNNFIDSESIEDLRFEFLLLFPEFDENYVLPDLVLKEKVACADVEMDELKEIVSCSDVEMDELKEIVSCSDVEMDECLTRETNLNFIDEICSKLRHLHIQ